MALILEQDYTFVTNNRTGFLMLYRRASLRAGLIVIAPNITPQTSAGTVRGRAQLYP
jgi:hypothetical protein